MAKITNWIQAVRKAVEWRTISFFIDLLVAFMLTRQLDVSFGIASTVGFIKFITNLIWIKKRFS